MSCLGKPEGTLQRPHHEAARLLDRLSITWRMLQPPRGSGRLLWACEQMVSPAKAAALKDRATSAAIDLTGKEVRARGAAGSVLAVWTGTSYLVTPLKRGYAAATRPTSPPNDPSASQSGAAVFSWRDDYLATGWLSAYSRIKEQKPSAVSI